MTLEQINLMGDVLMVVAAVASIAGIGFAIITLFRMLLGKI
jgi:hypothetical protein